jgi:hypothetical protein
MIRDIITAAIVHHWYLFIEHLKQHGLYMRVIPKDPADQVARDCAKVSEAILNNPRILMEVLSEE